MDSEADGFRIEAALDCGFAIANEDATEFICTEDQILDLVRRAEAKGRQDAILTLRRSDATLLFLNVGIGQPFWAHDKVWIRTDYEAATELGSTGQFNRKSTCNFTLDECDKIVGVVDFYNGETKL